MDILPAIDVLDGQVVRLRAGDFERKTVFGNDPVALARDYARHGARWLHLVDLTGARDGQSGIANLLGNMRDHGLRVQVGGGVRSGQDVETLFAAGAQRVVVGSIAASAPETVAKWLRRYGVERVVVALDVRQRDSDWWVASHGWRQDEPVTLTRLVRFYAEAGARHLLCTDIARDGNLSGPNFALYERLRALAPALQLQVSGGVRALADIRRACELGAGGIVLGRTLLEGRFKLIEALAC